MGINRTVGMLALAAVLLPCALGEQHVLSLSRHVSVRQFNETSLADCGERIAASGSFSFLGWFRNLGSQSRALPSSSDDVKLRYQQGYPAQLVADVLQRERMMNIQNLQYTANLLIGTPGQVVRLVFDTGSSDLWVTDQAFQWRQSFTWHDTQVQETSLVYGKGRALGDFGLDSACLPTSPGPPLCVSHQPIILAREVEDMDLSRMDGILGLGFVGISHARLTFLRNLNRSFEDLSFAFALKEDSETSYLVFGEYDEVMSRGFKETGLSPDRVAHAKVEDVFRTEGMDGLQPGWWLVKVGVHATGHDAWDVKLVVLQKAFMRMAFVLLFTVASVQAVMRATARFETRPTGCSKFCTCLAIPLWGCFSVIGCVLLCSTLWFIARAGDFNDEVHAALDTGTSLVMVPNWDFDGVALGMFGVNLYKNCATQAGNLLCLCSIVEDVHPLTVEVGGVPIVMKAQEMFMKVGIADGQDVCMTGLAASEQPIWILGDVFLRQVYAVHNFKRREVSLFPYQYMAQMTDLVAESSESSVRISKLPAAITFAIATLLVLVTLGAFILTMRTAHSHQHLVLAAPLLATQRNLVQPTPEC